MKKLIALFSLALLFIGCAPSAKSVSNFKEVFPLKGETVVVATSAHKDYTSFANEVSDSVAVDMNARGVNVVTYKADEEALELSDSPVGDLAKEKGATYILLQTFTTLKIYNAALESFEEEISLYSVAEKKPVWKASISWTNPMPLGTIAGVRSAREEVTRLLVQDGFLEAAPAQK